MRYATGGTSPHRSPGFARSPTVLWATRPSPSRAGSGRRGGQRRTPHLGGRLPRVPNDRADGGRVAASRADARVLGAPRVGAEPGSLSDGVPRGIRSNPLWRDSNTQAAVEVWVVGSHARNPQGVR